MKLNVETAQLGQQFLIDEIRDLESKVKIYQMSEKMMRERMIEFEAECKAKLETERKLMAKFVTSIVL